MPLTPLERAARLTPGGSQTRSKAGLFPEGPHFIERAFGTHVWDEKGREYVDWIAGLASVGLGYAEPRVHAAVCATLEHGNTLPLPSLLEADAAAALLRAVHRPADMVRWVKTGSEATDGAVIIARKWTGRRKVLSVGYHGWHAVHLTSPGGEVRDVRWGDLGLLRRELRGTHVAAVLLEPMRDHEPPDGYLQAAQAEAHDAGALFVLDEIVTGFRWARGGATELYGLDPDLICYGKALANGYPLGAIVGRRDIMEMGARGVSSTFGGERIGLAAAVETLRIYETEPVIQRLWETGRKLMQASPVPMLGFPVHPRLDIPDERERRAFCQRVAHEGVLLHPAGFNPMYAHTDADIEETARAIRAAL